MAQAQLHGRFATQYLHLGWRETKAAEVSRHRTPSLATGKTAAIGADPSFLSFRRNLSPRGASAAGCRLATGSSKPMMPAEPSWPQQVPIP
mmetsp:Transcript_44701/g.101116  ORF Transcript_44701/g.101116 Transcript_44701/m.101116 type:complete len:91 (-) Transcript_44701:1624-1896(-)